MDSRAFCPGCSLLFQSDDIQRAGWNLYRSTVLLCSYVVFYRIDVGRIVDGVLLQTILGRKADELAILDFLALKINLRCGVLGAGVGNLQDYFARLFIKCGCREDARKGVCLQLGREYFLAIQLGEDAVSYNFQLDVIPLAGLDAAWGSSYLTLGTIHDRLHTCLLYTSDAADEL